MLPCQDRVTKTLSAFSIITILPSCVIFSNHQFVCDTQTSELLSEDLLEAILAADSTHSQCNDSIHNEFRERVCTAVNKQLMKSVLERSTADSQDPTKVIQ